MVRGIITLATTALLLVPGLQAKPHLRRLNLIDYNDGVVSVHTPFGDITVDTRPYGGGTTVETPVGTVNTDSHGNTNVSMPFANVNSNGQGTTVEAPFTNVNSNGQGTTVDAPGTHVDSNGQGTTVEAPGTHVDSNGQGTTVEAPLTNVNANGHGTTVEAPGTSVNADGHGTTVDAPATHVDSNGQGTTVTAPGTSVNAPAPKPTATPAPAPAPKPTANGVAQSQALQPSDCKAWPANDPCHDVVDPFFRIVGAGNTTDRLKDNAVEDFCKSECGVKYTNRISGLISGYCEQANNVVIKEKGNGAEVKASKAGVPQKDVVVEGSRDPLHFLQFVGVADDANAVANTTPATPAAAPAAAPAAPAAGDVAATDPLLTVRAGASLGCLTSSEGKKCALLRGCDFWTSCCAANLVLARKAAHSDGIDATTINNIDRLCPGAKKYISGEHGVCF